MRLRWPLLASTSLCGVNESFQGRYCGGEQTVLDVQGRGLGEDFLLTFYLYAVTNESAGELRDADNPE